MGTEKGFIVAAKCSPEVAFEQIKGRYTTCPFCCQLLAGLPEDHIRELRYVYTWESRPAEPKKSWWRKIWK